MTKAEFYWLGEVLGLVLGAGVTVIWFHVFRPGRLRNHQPHRSAGMGGLRDDPLPEGQRCMALDPTNPKRRCQLSFPHYNAHAYAEDIMPRPSTREVDV